MHIQLDKRQREALGQTMVRCPGRTKVRLPPFLSVIILT
jgi:hypothetical protein